MASSAHRGVHQKRREGFWGQNPATSAAGAQAAHICPFFIFLIIREAACRRAETAVTQAWPPFWTRILKRALFGLFFCQLATALGSFRFRRRAKSRLHRGTAAAPAARRSAGPCGWAAAARPDTIIYDSGADGVARPRAPRVEIPVTDGLGVVCGALPTRTRRPHRSARRWTARGAAREADGSGDARTQGRVAAPPAGGRRRRARSSLFFGIFDDFPSGLPSYYTY